MDDMTKVLLTSSLTVLGGVTVFVAGQLAVKFAIEPIHELKPLLGEIRFALIFYAQAIHTPVGDTDSENEAAKALRRLSSDLRSKVEVIPLYRCWSKLSFGFLPQRKNLLLASNQLMGLSNSVHHQDRSEKNTARIAKIERLLNYEPVEW